MRDHRHIRVPHLEPAQVGDHDAPATAERKGHLPQLALRQRGEALTQAQFVEQLQRRRVHRVATEVAQKVRVLLQHGDLDAGPGEQQPEDHTSRSAADNKAGRARDHRRTPYSTADE